MTASQRWRCYSWSGDAACLLQQQARAEWRRRLRPMTTAELQILASEELELHLSCYETLPEVASWLWAQLASIGLADSRATRSVRHAYRNLSVDLTRGRDIEWAVIDGPHRIGHYLAVLRPSTLPPLIPHRRWWSPPTHRTAPGHRPSRLPVRAGDHPDPRRQKSAGRPLTNHHARAAVTHTLTEREKTDDQSTDSRPAAATARAEGPARQPAGQGHPEPAPQEQVGPRGARSPTTARGPLTHRNER